MKRFNWRFFGGCAVVGLMLSTAYTLGVWYGPSSGYTTTDAEKERAMHLCKAEVGIDTRQQIELCMADELMTGHLLEAHLREHPDTVQDGCLQIRSLIGNRIALDCAMGRTGKTRKASAEPDASTSI